MKYCLSPLEISQAQAIFHCIPSSRHNTVTLARTHNKPSSQFSLIPTTLVEAADCPTAAGILCGLLKEYVRVLFFSDIFQLSLYYSLITKNPKIAH